MPSAPSPPELAQSALALLRRSRSGALATHSLAWPGVPYASWLAFSTDDEGNPMFCISRLAEHTRNLAAAAPCSLLVAGDQPAHAPERATLVGNAELVMPSALLSERLLRYQPEAARFLSLGDFAWWRLQVSHVRYIAGFGRMGVAELEHLAALPCLALQAEAALIAGQPEHDVVGVDFLGCDVRRNGQLIRYDFPALPETVADVAQLLAQTLAEADHD